MELVKLFSVGVVSLLGAMSPGPDFAIVTKNSLSGSLKKGLLTALGVSVAVCIHLSYCLLGVAFVLLESPLLFNLIKYLGAFYLFYLGVKILRSKASAPDDSQCKKGSPFVSGFVCNLLNPKATLFFLSLFTQFIDPTMVTSDKVSVGVMIVAITLIWFSFLAYLITHKAFQKRFAQYQQGISKGMGVVLCLLALYVAIGS